MREREKKRFLIKIKGLKIKWSKCTHTKSCAQKFYIVKILFYEITPHKLCNMLVSVTLSDVFANSTLHLLAASLLHVFTDNLLKLSMEWISHGFVHLT